MTDPQADPHADPQGAPGGERRHGEPPRHGHAHRDSRQRFTARLGHLARAGASNRPGVGWRMVVPAVFAAAGFLFVTSAEASNGFDLRPQRPASLAELVQSESNRVDRLQQRAGQLEDQIDTLTARVDTKAIERLQDRADDLRGPAGMLPVSGSALKVTLDDAPADQPVPEGFDVNAMVVHQQDLQAVVNALWAGGAEGITLQGVRLISTTGIKCVGNTVVLHGVPYSPPYEIVAVGNPVALQSAIDRSEYVQTYLEYTEEPVNIGWDVDLLADVTLPGHEAAVNLRYAEVAARPGG
ncbi:MAG TPA: DUF881 domain-containing protein [Nocardioidaceae bacterium]|nr:DUF881 domain-containing protein [Nocardioidaceae bacterium]